MIRCYLTSTREKDGKIKHEYSKRVNLNPTPEEHIVTSFDNLSYKAKRMEEMHEELMKINPEIITVRMTITEEPEKSPLLRIINAVTE